MKFTRSSNRSMPSTASLHLYTTVNRYLASEWLSESIHHRQYTCLTSSRFPSQENSISTSSHHLTSRKLLEHHPLPFQSWDSFPLKIKSWLRSEREKLHCLFATFGWPGPNDQASRDAIAELLGLQGMPKATTHVAWATRNELMRCLLLSKKWVADNFVASLYRCA